MSKSKFVYEEYERLKSLFLVVEENKQHLVDDLLQKAAFLKVELDSLQEQIKKYGSVQISNKGNQRETVAYKSYLSSLSLYQTIIRTLNSILGKNISDNDDDFDDFIKRANEQ